ncbi:MAG: M23 family metallopeptidase [Candidatus Kapabacteria bacterium]|nr:M23 family metallopeptidase [Candidatus Kapabacteria bacterium]
MLKFFLLSFTLFLIFLSNTFSCENNSYIENRIEIWKSYYVNTQPTDTARNWYLPFETSNRLNPKTMSVVSTFGSPRNSYVKGHIHTGLDCIPKSSGENVDIYSMSDGIVCSIHLAHPYITIVVKHKTISGEIIFTSYKHLAEVYVKTGDNVNHKTKLARLYTRKETKKYGGRYDHLHLEIRKDFGDYGPASWATMTKEELNCRFYDPLIFIRENVR